MNNASLVFDALLFAYNAHYGTFRKGTTDVPYFLHPVEAALIVASETSDPALIAAALLHDTVEDTGTTLEELRERFGDRIADLVADETVVDDGCVCSCESWRTRKEENLRRLSAASRDAKLAALGDKLANMRAIHRDYHALGDAFWTRFNVSDPAQQGWYYRSLVNVLSDLRDTPAWQELSTLVDGVFSVD